MTQQPLTHRLDIAARTAERLADEYPAADIWLEGAVAAGCAHAFSDIDLRLVIPQGEVPVVRSTLIEGVRVDLTATSAVELDTARALLHTFEVRLDNIETFRTVRTSLPMLTAIRTARAYRDSRFTLVASTAERTGYQRWALADRAQEAASLAEDLVGLAAVGLHPHADLVWQRLAIVLVGAEAVAAAAPLLGDKWLPSLHSVGAPAAPTRLPDASWALPDGPVHWFAAAQVRLADALLAVWPTDARPEFSYENAVTGFGWLPQRYADTFFLQLGDTHVPLTDGQFVAWRDHAERHSHVRR